MSTLDQIIEQLPASEIEASQGWMQGRALFGGLVAALLYEALRHQVPDRLVRSLTVSFVGPVTPGPLKMAVETFRQGKSVTQAESRLLQNDQVQAVMLASFGAGRSSSIQVAAPEAPELASPETGFALPSAPGLTPEFVQHFDFRWLSSYLPLSGADRGEIAGWVRFAQPVKYCGIAHLLALVDAWPPSVLPMFRQPAPSSSLTWTIEFTGRQSYAGGNPWWQYQAATDTASEGYAHSQASLHDDEGRLVAISRQTIAVFA